ncbi:MAG: YIP1 family protein [Parcubacteria group bacterium]
MNYLSSPVKSFKAIAKHPRVSDAVFVVASIWIVLLGLQLARLAEIDALTWPLALRSLAVTAFGVIAVWLAAAGLGHLLAQTAGGKARFTPLVVIAGLAATPLAIAGILAIVVDLIAAVVPLSDYAVTWITRSLLWAGLIVGTPGLYYALGLQAVSGIKRVTAGLIAVFLTLSVVLVVLLQQ